MDKRQVHIRDIEGKLLYTRLYDDGHGPLTFDGGIGFIDRLDLQRYRWQVLDGWPSTQNAEPEPDTASSEPATDGGFGTGTGADADYLTRFERRWDRLWPLACRVANAVRRCDEAKEQADVQWWEQELRDACRKLQRAVDEICPD